MASISTHEALIYVMVSVSAVDRDMSDNELQTIGRLIGALPVFRRFDSNRLIDTAKACSTLLSEEDSLEKVLRLIAESVPSHLHDTAYALAVEVAAADLSLAQEELRFLQLLRNRLDLDKLTAAAIERSAQARFRSL